MAITLMAAVGLPNLTAADPADDFSFDIFAKDEMIEVWVDLNQLVSESNWDQLKDGADIAFELSFSLTTPRRFIGETEVVRSEQAIRLSYHPVTETYYCGFSTDRFEEPLKFTAREELMFYLTDSLLFAISPITKLNAIKNYSLKITVTKVSIAELSRYTEDPDDPDRDSPLEPLFRAFLNLTQFGRQEFVARSRLLSLDELTN